MTSSLMGTRDHGTPVFRCYRPQPRSSDFSWHWVTFLPLIQKAALPWTVFNKLFSSSSDLPGLARALHNNVLFSLGRTCFGSNSLPPEAPVCNYPGETSRGSQENPDSSVKQKGSRTKATSQEVQVIFSSFKIHRTKYTVKTTDCDVQVSGKPKGIHPFGHQQLFVKHLLHASLGTAYTVIIDKDCWKSLTSYVRVSELGGRIGK